MKDGKEEIKGVIKDGKENVRLHRAKERLKKYLEKEEFLDMVAIAESTPGPIAINAATYLGYKHLGFFGSLFATVGVVIPSFIIIFAISFLGRMT